MTQNIRDVLSNKLGVIVHNCKREIRILDEALIYAKLDSIGAEILKRWLTGDTSR